MPPVKLLLDNLPPSLRSQRESLAACLEAFNRVTPVKRVLMFGSHARGEATRDSDVDLCVVAEGAENQQATVRRYYDAIWKLRPVPSFTLIPIAPQRLQEKQRAGDHFFRTVLEEGIPLAQED